VLGLAASLAAQERVTDQNAHLWLTYDGNHAFGGTRWRAHLEGHWRRNDLGLKWQQLLLRPGITYALTPNLGATLGYAFIETWPYGRTQTGTKFTEHRAWEQILATYRTGRASWGSRGRFEGRWLEGLNGGWRYENRLRLMQRLTIPINRRTYFTAHDEFWVYVKPFVSNSTFDQNRAYTAIGWNLGEGWSVETGYMHQALLRRSGLVLESNHTIRITLVSGAPFRAR
jgi:hypothetical protein